MFGLGPTELIFISVVAVVLFGGNLPEVARKFGSAYHDLRRSLNDVQQQFREAEYEARRTVKKATTFDEAEAEADEPPPAPAATAPKFKLPPSEKA